jgi:hypothetical protein
MSSSPDLDAPRNHRPSPTGVIPRLGQRAADEIMSHSGIKIGHD